MENPQKDNEIRAILMLERKAKEIDSYLGQEAVMGAINHIKNKYDQMYTSTEPKVEKTEAEILAEIEEEVRLAEERRLKWLKEEEK